METKPTELFKKIRQEHKLSQNKMAEKLGVNQTTLSRIENGTSRPSPRLISKLKAFTSKSLKEIQQKAKSTEAYTHTRSLHQKFASMKPLAELPIEMQEYLKNKWSAEIVEMKKSIKSYKIKLNSLLEKQLYYEQEASNLQKETEIANTTLQHLKRTNAAKVYINKAEETYKKLQNMYSEMLKFLNTFADADIYIKILYIKELEQKVKIRQAYIEEIGN